MDQLDRGRRRREDAQSDHEHLDRAGRTPRSRAGYPLGDYASDFTTKRLLLAWLAVLVFIVVLLVLMVVWSEGDDVDAVVSTHTRAFTLVQQPSWLRTFEP